MRVITGKAKGRKLQSVPGDTTRPITDRAKEALFSILGDWIVDTRVLDLFGGTGGVGIECLSRGADFVQFIDQNRKAVETIQANLAHTKLDRQAAVERGDSFAYLQRYRGEPYDLIFVAPPQYQGMWITALKQIDANPTLRSEYCTVVVQIHPREDTEIELTSLVEYDRRRYGSVLLLFFASPDAVADSGAGEDQSDDEEFNDDELDDDELDDEELDDEELEDEELEDEELDDEELDDEAEGDKAA